MIQRMFEHEFWECKNFVETMNVKDAEGEVDEPLSEAKFFALKLLNEVERIRAEEVALEGVGWSAIRGAAMRNAAIRKDIKAKMSLEFA